MLSTFASKSGVLAAACARCPQRVLGVFPVTHMSSISQRMEEWDKANAVYYGPERDMKNFPTQRMAELPKPVRLGFIPDSWFQALYPKTGVTGPYVFTVGLLGFLFSKEIWVVDHNFSEVLCFWSLVFYVHFKYGLKIRTFVQEHVDVRYNKMFVQPITAAKKNYLTKIEKDEKDIWCSEGQKHLHEAKAENVDLQLEAAYRQRVQDVYSSVKKRLDYHVDVLNTRKRFEQEHMVNWIVSGVMKSITPQQEKESLSNCIQTLKKLSAA